MTTHGRPSASLALIQQRAQMNRAIRDFFYHKGVCEVETPLLGKGNSTDPFIDPLSVSLSLQPGAAPQTFFLQTSPEFAMKRLLAHGSGSIYQLGKAFRAEEIGRHHHPEFTMLEWYRVGFDHHALMDEVDELLHLFFDDAPSTRITYQGLFQTYLNICPLTASLETLQTCAQAIGLSWASEAPTDRTALLQALLATHIEPHLGHDAPCFLYDFPPEQAALARIRGTGPEAVAERFEVYVRGVELANGYHELADATEQRARMTRDQRFRQAHQKPFIPLDEDFLGALAYGLPDCAGVALGVDRLLMLITQQHTLASVLSFAFETS